MTSKTQPDLVDSPGGEYLDIPLQMKVPHLDFIYRLSCEMSPQTQRVGAAFDSSHSRVIMPIVGGVVKGPRISATIEKMSGADWGMGVTGAEFMRLDARYTLKTDDDHYIFVKSKGIFSPKEEGFLAKRDPANMSQDEVEWFTRLQFETDSGPYNWMNSIMGMGVLSMCDGKIIIDAYRVTNFPGLPAKDVHIKS